MNYRLEKNLPEATEYCDLRISSGMSAKDHPSAKEALKRSLFGVSIRDHSNGELIGMGRIIGDFTALQVVDIAVDPRHQGKKIGKRIMEEIMNYIKTSVPRSCFVNLFSDIDFLYEKYGFVNPTTTRGMKLDWDRIKDKN